MSERIDQVFVLLKHALLAHVTGAWAVVLSAVLSIVPLFVVFPLLFAITTWLERKGLGRIQNRYGPNRVGPMGLLQPMADGLKALTKEDVVPFRADHAVHFLAPLVMVVPTFLAFAVIPYGRNMTPLDLDAGILFFFAVGAFTELAVFMAGWASRNKYSLLGALRAIAQMLSYELPLVLSTVPVLIVAGTLSLPSIVASQAGYWHGLPRWHLFTPWGAASFLLFLIAGMAEANRSPFDIPEGESEIIAGHLVEYSGFKYALFFLGEYLGLFAMSGLAITLFLGGWAAPLGFLTFIPSYCWFFLKLIVFIAFFIWVRGTVPRLRMDQLMQFAWQFLLPLSLLNIVAAGLWVILPSLGWRWVAGTVLVIGGYVLLGKGMSGHPKRARRTYRFAE